MPDLLVLAQELWDETERRNQLILRAVSRRHPSMRVLFAERPMRPREMGHWRLPRVREVAPNIWALRPVRPLPDRFGRAADRLEAAQIRRGARVAGLRSPMIWTQDPRAASLLDLLDRAGLIYDLTDDWPAFETDVTARDRVERQVQHLAGAADVTIACSRPLLSVAERWSQRSAYLPNAVDPLTEPAPAPADIAALPRPRLGYVGTLHASRLDVDLLAEIAGLKPQWSFVLLGPNLLDDEDNTRLFSRPNVHYLGLRPHDRVRAYLESLEVCLVPHVLTDFTRSLDPLKLYEYLAAGRPVISTPVGNAPELEAHVTTATTAVELVAAAERCIASDTEEGREGRRAAVAGATWDARAAQLEQVLGVAAAAEPDGSVDVVIVSYQTRELLRRCLEHLRRQDGVSWRAIVVDNGSTDGSQEMVRDQFAEAELIELGENAGFGAANNIAFGRSTGEFVLLLNSDAFLADGALATLVATARADPSLGAVGPRLLNPDGTLQRSAWPFPTAGRLALEAVGLHRPLRRAGVLEDLGTWSHDDQRDVDFLVGACLLVRRAALRDVGGFDERYWLYGEEADLQRRMANYGWRVRFTPAATTEHVGGASSSVSLTRMRHFYRGQRTFLQDHGPVGAWPVAWVALVVGSLLRWRGGAVRAAFSLGPRAPLANGSRW